MTAGEEQRGALRLTHSSLRWLLVLLPAVLFVVTVLAQEVRLDGLGLTLPVVEDVRLRIHDLAAVFLICALAVAVASHAWPGVAARAEGETPSASALRARAGYRVVFALMVAGPVVAWLASRLWAPGHAVILLEWWEIGLFCVFWVRQTRRLHRSDPGAERAASPGGAVTGR